MVRVRVRHYFLLWREKRRTFHNVRVHRGGEEKLGHLRVFMEPDFLFGCEDKLGFFLTTKIIEAVRKNSDSSEFL
jgi:hypothetical protein